MSSLRYFDNLGMFECAACGLWMKGKMVDGAIPDSVTSHVEKTHPGASKFVSIVTVAGHRPPASPYDREAAYRKYTDPSERHDRDLIAVWPLLDLIISADDDAQTVSVLRDNKMTTGIAMKIDHWCRIVQHAKKIKEGLSNDELR